MSVQKLILTCLCGMLLWSVPMSAQTQTAKKQAVKKEVIVKEKTLVVEKKRRLGSTPVSKKTTNQVRGTQKQVVKKQEVQPIRENEIEEID